PTPFPAAGGGLYVLLVDPGLQDRFAEALELTPGPLVVWRPGDPSMIEELQFPKVEEVVRRCFHPCERFGHIEVWVRSDQNSGFPCPPPTDHAHRPCTADPSPWPDAGARHEGDAQSERQP